MKRLAAEPDIHFLFVGEGAEKEKLKQLAAEARLENITFINQQPREALLGFYRASDVSLVPLKRLPIFRKVLPSKLFELMGAGCPIICSVEGEAAQLVARADSGLCIEPENPAAMVEAILRLRSDAALRGQLRDNGRAFVRKNYLRSALAERYLESLGTILSGRLAIRGATPPAAEHRPPVTDN
ncbi:MAG: glycosyltransferase family 4 protein [Blastocatellia bacterium]|nr:glycosyltransferase family 4 protein [Blastocatellia bacterium]